MQLPLLPELRETSREPHYQALADRQRGPVSSPPATSAQDSVRCWRCMLHVNLIVTQVATAE